MDGMTLIAHIADVHLGYAQYGLSEREQDIYEVFEEAVELILRERAEILLIAGDLFDAPRPPIKALMKARSLLSKLRDRGVEIYHVIGDHELPRRMGDLPPTAILDGVSKHLGLRNVEAGDGLVLTGLDRLRPSLKAEALGRLRKLAEEAGRSRRSILVAHVPLRGAERAIGELPRGYGYYALGHEHERRIFSIDGSAAAYPGSMEILSIAEIEAWERGGSGFLLVDYSGSEPIIHEVNLKSIRPQKLLTARIEDLDRVLEEAARWSEDQAKKPIIHFRIRGRRVDKREIARRIDEVLRGRTLYYRYEVFEEAEEVEKAEGVEKLDLRSILRSYMSAKGFSEEEIELATTIYETYIARGAEEVERMILSRLEDSGK